MWQSDGMIFCILLSDVDILYIFLVFNKHKGGKMWHLCFELSLCFLDAFFQCNVLYYETALMK